MDSNHELSTSLAPSLQETRALLQNFSRDTKRARSSFLNCDRPIPQFPQTEWLNLLSGNSVDLNHVFSNIYTVSHNSNKLSSLGSILSCSTDRPHQQRPLKPTAIGSSGTALSTLHYLCSNTGDKGFKRMANTSSITSCPCHCNSTPELSTMTELFKSELLSDEILNSQISPSLQTCRSSGSTIHRIHPQVNLQNVQTKYELATNHGM